MSFRLSVILSSVAFIVTAVALVVTAGFIEEDGIHIPDPPPLNHAVIAKVGNQVLLEEELVLTGGGNIHVEQWVNDELLAQLAVEQGLEDPRTSMFVQKRARQVYLRDLILDDMIRDVNFPTDQEIYLLILSDSSLYQIERHYYHILLADSIMADSIYAKISRGEHFQTIAERLSIGQKAGLGGDIGFLVGGELLDRFPADVAMLEGGISEIHQSPYGYHIFLVMETRALTDTVRVINSLKNVIYNARIKARIETLLNLARAGREVEVFNFRR